APADLRKVLYENQRALMNRDER
ncbi:MAG: hypothetical protein QOI71_889, partial [Gaiellales bacterium]|nr:hypothetical protein [Gaiellales bacterium]